MTQTAHVPVLEPMAITPMITKQLASNTGKVIPPPVRALKALTKSHASNHEPRVIPPPKRPVPPGVHTTQTIDCPIPSMMDIFSGPNAPLALAFKLCGWEATAWDKLIDPNHDLTIKEHRDELAKQCHHVTLITAALPCDTKTRIREILRFFPDGRPTASPLRSEEYPEGLPQLRGADKKRVDEDNLITDFILELQQQQAHRDLAAIRENPTRSLQWWQAKELEMWGTGKWMEKCYAACSLMGTRCKQQTL